MSDIQTPAEHELAELIVQALNLETVTAAEIKPEAALFGDDLGLDSIDALELGIALRKKYKVQLEASGVGNREHFRSVNSLALLVKASTQPA